MCGMDAGTSNLSAPTIASVYKPGLLFFSGWYMRGGGSKAELDQRWICAENQAQLREGGAAWMRVSNPSAPTKKPRTSEVFSFMEATFYILYFSATDRYYVGHTTEPMSERLRKHNSAHDG